MAKTFLHAGQDGLVVAGFHVHNTVGGKARLGEGRREQIRFGDAPEGLAGRAPGDPSGEKSCRRAIDRAVAAAGDFVQRASCQSAARKPRIDFGDTERKHRFGALGPPFEADDPLSKFDNR